MPTTTFRERPGAVKALGCTGPCILRSVFISCFFLDPYKNCVLDAIPLSLPHSTPPPIISITGMIGIIWIQEGQISNFHFQTVFFPHKETGFTLFYFPLSLLNTIWFSKAQKNKWRYWRWIWIGDKLAVPFRSILGEQSGEILHEETLAWYGQSLEQNTQDLCQRCYCYFRPLSIDYLISAASGDDHSPASPMKAGTGLYGLPFPGLCTVLKKTNDPLSMCKAEIGSLSLCLVWPITICLWYPHPFETIEKA